jgi:PAS domain S-box-containing protein
MVAWNWDVGTGRVEWPPELETMLGVAPGSIRGRLRDVRARIHPEDQRRVIAAVERALSSQDRYRDQYRIVLPDGRVAWLDVSGRVYRDERGEPVRMHGLVSDVTDRKHAELLLREAARKQDEFLAVLGHELRNPMAPIQNCMHVLRMPAVPEEQRQQAWTMLERQVGHLNRLVDDLLDVSRLARGRILLREERVDIAELVRSTAADFRSSLEARDLDLVVRVPDDPVWMVGDRARLAQALGNLLHNAGKFSRRDGAVTIELQQLRGTAMITVRDDGIGMPPDLIARLFQPFVQADLGSGQLPVGLGLGLTLVKALVELHRGTVEARSSGEGKGSEFVIRLPLERPAGAQNRFDLTHAPVMRRLRILVIEDHPDVAQSMELLLGLAGHEVQVASDGATGVERARTFRPQVVLCDLGLPGAMDGFAVARALREDPELSSIYRVALTGYGLTRDQQRSREAGFDAHLTKPVLYSDLERVLATASLPPE